MRPLKPNPNAAETANSPASSCVKTNPSRAAAWQVEAAKIVLRPPTRSVSHPQNKRLTKALPSSTDNMKAPRVAGMPRSLQNATRCPGGIAIGVQHRNPATHNKMNVALDPAAVPAVGFASLAAEDPHVGGGRSHTRAASRMASVVAIPNTTRVARQPNSWTPNAMKGGHSAPAMYCPLETSATADPRCRSNQRLM